MNPASVLKNNMSVQQPQSVQELRGLCCRNLIFR